MFQSPRTFIIKFIPLNNAVSLGLAHTQTHLLLPLAREREEGVVHRLRQHYNITQHHRARNATREKTEDDRRPRMQSAKDGEDV